MGIEMSKEYEMFGLGKRNFESLILIYFLKSIVARKMTFRNMFGDMLGERECREVNANMHVMMRGCA